MFAQQSLQPKQSCRCYASSGVTGGGERHTVYRVLEATVAYATLICTFYYYYYYYYHPG